jgi:hypothetical protein
MAREPLPLPHQPFFPQGDEPLFRRGTPDWDPPAGEDLDSAWNDFKAWTNDEAYQQYGALWWALVEAKRWAFW